MQSHQTPDFNHATRTTTLVATVFSLTVGGGLIIALLNSGADTGASIAVGFLLLILSIPIIITQPAFVFPWIAKHLYAKQRFNISMFLLAQVSLLFGESLLITLAFKLLPNIGSLINNLRGFFIITIGLFIMTFLPVLLSAGVWLWFAKRHLTHHSSGTPNGAP